MAAGPDLYAHPDLQLPITTGLRQHGFNFFRIMNIETVEENEGEKFQ